MGYIPNIVLKPDIESIKQDTTILTSGSNSGKNFYSDGQMGTLDTTNVWTSTVSNSGTTSNLSDTSYRVIWLKAESEGATARLDSKNRFYNKTDGALTFTCHNIRFVSLENSNAVVGLSTSNAATDSILFKSTANALNAVVTKNTTATTEVLNAAIGTTYHDVSIIINADWTSISFYLDSVLITTITTNIPDDVFLQVYMYASRTGDNNAGVYCGDIGVEVE